MGFAHRSREAEFPSSYSSGWALAGGAFQPEEGFPAGNSWGRRKQLRRQISLVVTARALAERDLLAERAMRHPLLTAIAPPPPPPLTPQDQHQPCCRASNYIFKILSGREDVTSSNCGRVFRETHNYTVIKPVKHTTVPFVRWCWAWLPPSGNTNTGLS